MGEEPSQHSLGMDESVTAWLQAWTSGDPAGHPGVLRMFRRERQILARLEHPNIARFLDGGTTDDGIPFVVLEYVLGAPVTEACDARCLGVRQRLELFLKICRAVYIWPEALYPATG